MDHKEKAKLRVLQLIREKKDTLFGAFSAKLTKLDKIDGWETILEEAKKLGLIPSNKCVSYLRDIYWQNIRKRTMKKIDDSHVTGAAGGEKCVLDDIDKLVIDIIGKHYHRLFTLHEIYS